MWAAGPTQYDIIKEELEKKDININNIDNIKIVPYIYNMEEIMNISDLVICRSGAMTITEIALLRKACYIYSISGSCRKSSRI